MKEPFELMQLEMLIVQYWEDTLDIRAVAYATNEDIASAAIYHKIRWPEKLNPAHASKILKKYYKE